MGKAQRKPIVFCGATLKTIRELPRAVQDDLGHRVDLVQQGFTPQGCTPVKRVGPGTMELRIWNDDGTYRVLYVAKFEEAVYILHTFKKTTEKISQVDIDIAKENYKEIP